MHLQAGLKKVNSRAGRQHESGRQQQPEEPATVKAAARVSTAVLERELKEEEKGPAANLVHYLFGTVAGGMNGAIAEDQDTARAGFGTLFGSVRWLVSDEIAVPAWCTALPPRRRAPVCDRSEAARAALLLQ